MKSVRGGRFELLKQNLLSNRHPMQSLRRKEEALLVTEDLHANRIEALPGNRIEAPKSQKEVKIQSAKKQFYGHTM